MQTLRYAALLAWAAMLAVDAHAAGFAIFEQGARGMGMAGAYTANPKDASAIFHNAAGIAFLKGKQFYGGGTFVHPKSTLTGDDPLPGAGVVEKGDVGVIPVPAFYYTQQASERLVLGVGVHAPYGLATKWANPDTFTGRFLSLEANLKSLAINPTVAYKVRDRLAVGAGLDIRASQVALRRRVPAVNPFTQKVVDIAEVKLESTWNWGVGFNVGVVAKPSEELSFGAAYRHKVRVDYGGTAAFAQIPTGSSELDTIVAASLAQGARPIATNITFPGIANIGVAYEWNDWTLAGDVVWYQWSTFKELAIDFTDTPGIEQLIPEDYESSLQLRLGVERRINEWWEVRGGYFYDQTPAPAASVTPLLPDASRHGLALGGSFVQAKWRLDAGLWYLLFKSRSTEGKNRDNYNGTYDNTALTLSASVGYRF